MDNVIGHPKFDRDPVVYTHRGNYPKEVANLRLYRREKKSKLVCAATIQTQESWEERARDLENKFDVISWHLLQAAKILAAESDK
ncbi:hypothetical protein [Caballeronia sp. dw_276]|uniref:hypothetical protein n=1 Tax=Caballeronia sp. dw_276 TaxID=2719795 RepID=UPI001BD4AE6C|nr:hypothetical protein [Caballeronia sp. dw_276]